MRQPLVIGNWKMNGSLVFTEEILHTLDTLIDDKISCEMGICTPFVYIKFATELTEHSVVKIGAQTVSEFSAGAYTGEVSAIMLKELGTHWVLIGHSERRSLFHEENTALIQKVLAAQSAGLIPVYCVGETEDDYKSGETFNVIADQVGALLETEDVDLNNLVLAYEPVWAIGTGLTASPEEAQKVHAYIRALVKEKNIESADGIQILYGGSVKPANAASLFGQEDIDGGLIGGASLDAEAFISICQQA